VTPAQAYGHPDFVNDWPVQGPTDPGIRAADCRYAQKLPTPQEAPCVDCKGPVPMFARTKGLLGEQVSFGGRNVRAFALAKAGDPDVWEKLTPGQQAWLAGVKQKLNDLIVQTTGTKCATWGPNVTSQGATTCFQNWYNSYGLTQLRTDGVLDQDTLSALIETAQAHPNDFPQFPGQAQPGTPPEVAAADAVGPKKLSTGAIVGIAAAGAAALGGAIYVATRKSGRKSRRRK